MGAGENMSTINGLDATVDLYTLSCKLHIVINTGNPINETFEEFWWI